MRINRFTVAAVAAALTVAGCAKKRYLKPRVNMRSAPPAGSTKTILFFSATAEAG